MAPVHLAAVCAALWAGSAAGVDVEREWQSLMDSLSIVRKQMGASKDPKAKKALAIVEKTLVATMTADYEAPPAAKMGGFFVNDGREDGLALDWIFKNLKVNPDGWDTSDFPPDLRRLINGDQVDLELTKYGATEDQLNEFTDAGFENLLDLVESGMHDLLDRMEDEGGLFPDEAHEKNQKKKRGHKPEWRRFDDDDDDEDEEKKKDLDPEKEVRRKSGVLKIPQDTETQMRGMTHVWDHQFGEELSFLWSINFSHLKKSKKVEEAWLALKNAEINTTTYPELRRIFDGHDKTYYDPLEENSGSPDRKAAVPVVRDLVAQHRDNPGKSPEELARTSFKNTGHDLTVDLPRQGYQFRGNRAEGHITTGNISYVGMVKESFHVFVPHGKGVLNDTDVVHVGEFRDGLAEGRGTRYHASDDCRYTGEFHRGQPHGTYAEYQCGACSGAYKGPWRRGRYHGRGEVVTNGVVVAADFVDGVPVPPLRVSVNGTTVKLDDETYRGAVEFALVKKGGAWKPHAARWVREGEDPVELPDGVAAAKKVVAKYDGRAAPEYVRVSTRCPLVEYTPTATKPAARCAIAFPSGFHYDGPCDGDFLHSPPAVSQAGVLTSATPGQFALEGVFRHGWYEGPPAGSAHAAAAAVIAYSDFVRRPLVDPRRGGGSHLHATVEAGDLTKPLYIPALETIADVVGKGRVWYSEVGAVAGAPALLVYDGQWAGLLPHGRGCLAAYNETVCARFVKGSPHGPAEVRPHNSTLALKVTYEHGFKQGWGTWKDSVGGTVLGRELFSNDRVTRREGPPNALQWLVHHVYHLLFRKDGELSDGAVCIVGFLVVSSVLALKRQLLGLGPAVDGWAQ